MCFDLRGMPEAVKLPQGTVQNEWITTHLVDIYNEISILYGSLYSLNVCTEQSCPIMNATNLYEYAWQDGVEYKKPTKVRLRIFCVIFFWLGCSFQHVNILNVF